jgi:uncharacterized membrane protein
VSYAAANLGFLAGGTYSLAFGNDATGGVTVGQATNAVGYLPVYWDAANVIHALPLPAGFDVLGIPYDIAAACSDDGSVIVGTLFGPGNTIDSLLHAVVWTSAGTVVTDLGGFGAPINGGTAGGCSANGSTICGAAYNPAETGTSLPCVWVLTDGVYRITALPLLAGYNDGGASGCSFDGQTVVGYVDQQPSGDSVPVVWTLTSGVWTATELGLLPGAIPSTVSGAIACSSNGTIAVGAAGDSAGDTNAAFWYVVADPGLANPLAGPYGGQNSYANDCDGSGSVICGDDVNGNPAVWIAGTGSDLPLFAGALAVTVANAISRNALVIVGVGTDAGSNTTAVKWTWSGPSPVPAAALAMANVVVTSLATESPCTVAQYTTPPSFVPGLGLRWSDTRGETFGNPVAQPFGTNAPLTQPQWNRTGYARDRVFELFWSAAAKTALNGAFVIVEPWKS